MGWCRSSQRATLGLLTRRVERSGRLASYRSHWLWFQEHWPCPPQHRLRFLTLEDLVYSARCQQPWRADRRPMLLARQSWLWPLQFSVRHLRCCPPIRTLQVRPWGPQSATLRPSLRRCTACQWRGLRHWIPARPAPVPRAGERPKRLRLMLFQLLGFDQRSSFLVFFLIILRPERIAFYSQIFPIRVFQTAIYHSEPDKSGKPTE